MNENITIALIILTTITSFYGWQNQRLFQRWIFNPFAVFHAGQYYRFLSAGFIHTNSMHLLFNMIALYFFGGVLERIYHLQFGYWGAILYLFTFIAGIVVSNLKTYFKYRNFSYYNSLGASGGVASVLFAAIIYRPTSAICLYFALCMPAFILGGIYLAYSYISGKRTGDNVNHDAHLFGSLFGIVFTILLRPSVVVEFIERIREFKLDEFTFF